MKTNSPSAVPSPSARPPRGCVASFPLERLERLCAASATGELVVAGEDLEVHVHLHRGRIAWAVSSARPNALVAHLLESCALDRETLRTAVEECRRSRRPFARILVEWDLASESQVRAAMVRQIREALTSLWGEERTEALFLPRAEKDVQHTFALADVHPLSDANHGFCGEVIRQRAQRIIHALPDLRWMHILSPSDNLFQIGDLQNGSLGHVQTLMQHLDRADLRSFGLRTTGGSVLGQRFSSGGVWSWAGVGPGVNLALVRSTLASASLERNGDVPSSGSTPSLAPAARGDLGGPARGCLTEAMERIDELRAAYVLSEDYVLSCLHQDTESRESGLERARTLAPALRAIAPTFGPTGASAEPQGWSAHLASERRWYFGAPLDGASGRFLWLTVSPRASLGFAWALVTSLRAQLLEADPLH
jgi:hypothetical protein